MHKHEYVLCMCVEDRGQLVGVTCFFPLQHSPIIRKSYHQVCWPVPFPAELDLQHYLISGMVCH